MTTSSAPLVTEKWWDASTVAVVTGANKGIGFEVARLLASEGVLVIGTSRDEARGAEALAKLKALAGPTARVEFQTLDVADKASIDRFATWLEKTHKGVTILVNNAGIAHFGEVTETSLAQAQETLGINLTGTMQMSERMKPLLLKDARIVNVSSTLGATTQMPDAARLQRFVAPTTTTAQLQELCTEFLKAVAEGKAEADGWVKPKAMYGAYCISKLFCSSYTRALSREVAATHPLVMVNACCPGYCATDLNNHGGPLTAAQGADTIAWQALKPPSAFVTGEFFFERTSKAW